MLNIQLVDKFNPVLDPMGRRLPIAVHPSILRAGYTHNEVEDGATTVARMILWLEKQPPMPLSSELFTDEEEEALHWVPEEGAIDHRAWRIAAAQRERLKELALTEGLQLYYRDGHFECNFNAPGPERREWPQALTIPKLVALKALAWGCSIDVRHALALQSFVSRLNAVKDLRDGEHAKAWGADSRFTPTIDVGPSWALLHSQRKGLEAPVRKGLRYCIEINMQPAASRVRLHTDNELLQRVWDSIDGAAAWNRVQILGSRHIAL